MRGSLCGAAACVGGLRQGYPSAAVPDTPKPLRTDLAGLPLRNPVLLAAGTAGYIDELSDAVDLSRVGAVVTKSITPEPREGNPAWRILDADAGMLNAIGLANVGAEAFAREHAPRAASAPTTVIGSIAGGSIDGYAAVAAVFEAAGGIPAAEVNVSCPNVHAGCQFGDDPGLLGELVAALRPVLKTTKLFVKLPPALANTPGHAIVDLARAAVDAGADALTVANTYPAMDIDPVSRRPRLSNVTGGLSGPAIRPITLRLVHLVYQGVARDAGVPLVAAGGVFHWRHAAAYILAGASAVQMGTATFADPRSPRRVVRGLEKWTRAQGAASVADLVGAVRIEEGRGATPGSGA